MDKESMDGAYKIYLMLKLHTHKKMDSLKLFGLETTKLESLIRSVRYVFSYLPWKTTNMTARIVQRKTNEKIYAKKSKGPQVSYQRVEIEEKALVQ